MNRRRGLAVMALLVAAGLAGCQQDARPYEFAFIGGLTGRVVDLGESGRNGAMLAAEEINAAGGIGGRPVKLSYEDDAQDPVKAVEAVRRLATRHVDVLIGPMTSSIATTILPEIERAGIVTISPTATASTLAGKDDLLFKVAPSVGEYTKLQVAHDMARGTRRVGIVYDLSNRAFSEDWANQYSKFLVASGGEVVGRFEFTAGDNASYGKAVQGLLGTGADTLMVVASAVDTVRVLQLARNLGLKQPVSASSWAGTESLIQLGGQAVEELATVQLFDREDPSPRYTAFAERYRTRFNQEPGFPSVAAYDAVMAVAQALPKAGAGGSLKQALLAGGPYQGLQESWSFDRYGDAQRKVRVTRVEGGKFKVVD